MFTLHNGDCLEVMPSIPSGSIDAIITDLPYGTTACKWDTVIEFAPMWKEVKRVLKPNGAFITTASQPFTSALVMSNPSMFKCEWIWNKTHTSNFSQAKKHPLKAHENIIVFGKKTITYNPQMTKKEKPIDDRNWKNNGRSENGNFASKTKHRYFRTESYPKSFIDVNSTSNECNHTKRLHPTQKPVALYEYLIRTYTNEGETVLDIAMGSGTTIEAAERTGRNSIGIEKDEGIFQSAVLRLKHFTPSNNRLHPDVGDSPAQGSLFTPEAGSAAGKSPKPAPRR